MKLPRISVGTALLYGAVALDVFLSSHPVFAQVGTPSSTSTSSAVASLQSAVKQTGANVGQTYQIGAYSAAAAALIVHGVKAMGASNNFNFMSMSGWVKGSGIVAFSGLVVGAITGTTPW